MQSTELGHVASKVYLMSPMNDNPVILMLVLHAASVEAMTNISGEWRVFGVYAFLHPCQRKLFKVYL